MRDRPIPFSGPMVRAVLEGRKTQTRRLVRSDLGNRGPLVGDHVKWFEPGREDPTRWCGHDGLGSMGWVRCPYGVPGDRLWGRETWRTMRAFDRDSGTAIADKCLDAGYSKPWAPLEYVADGERANWEPNFAPEYHGPGRLRQARFMPRWASRITLELTDVRVERLQDISEEDARAEGINGLTVQTGPGALVGRPRATEFGTLWDSINGKRARWADNPWVWVLTFRRLREEGKRNE